MKRLTALGFAILVAVLLYGCASGPDARYVYEQDRRPEIGDTGPGGGMIYYISGNEFWECSGDLGPATWGQAGIDARNYQGGGFNNWDLPSLYGLEQMYYNLKRNGIGGLADEFYWSNEGSSVFTSEALGFNFSKEAYFAHESATRTTEQRFRAVRSFTWRRSQ